MSDIIAFGILQEARALGVKVPEELSVVGFDDNLLARLITPQLTTVSQPGVEKGQLAASLLLRNLMGEEDLSQIILENKLVVRESTGVVPNYH